MKSFPVLEIAKEWAKRFGGTDGCEEKAWLAGAESALRYAMARCYSGSTPSMIRAELKAKVKEITGEEKA